MCRTVAPIALTLGLFSFAAAQQASQPAPQSTPPAAAKDAAPAPARSTGAATALPVSTPIELQLETHLDTHDLKHGDGFAARVLKPVYFNGQLAIPAGSIVEGHVVTVQDKRPALGNSELLLLPDLLSMPDGRKFTISANLEGNDPLNPAKVNSEGELVEPRGVMTADVHKGEIGGGAGLVGGMLLAGAHGAVIGGGVGVGVAAALWLVRVRHLDLTPGTRFTVTLDRALELRPVSAPVATSSQR